MKRSHFFTALAIVLFPLIAVTVTPVRADHDEVEPPWGTIHADLFGTATSADLPYTLGEGPMEEKWRLDVVAEGHDRPDSLSSITFDKDGNLYWISNTLGGTGGIIRLVSATPEGQIRWFGNDGGTLHQLGSTFGGGSPVVGMARVYATGDMGGILILEAYDKETGQYLWTADLSPSMMMYNNVLTPVLYDGKLYAVGLTNGKATDIYRIDAETGTIDWSSTVSEVKLPPTPMQWYSYLVGQMTFIPDAFDTGAHGLYFNGSSGSGGDGVSEVYGIKIEEDGASLGWSSEGGQVFRSHVIYNQALNFFYTLTWGDYGAEIYVFHPVNGFVSKHPNSLRSGHGYYDVGCLDFDGTIIAGAFEGNIFRYSDNGSGVIADEVIYKGGTTFALPFWGETRVFGQLFQDLEGNSVLISGTNSLGCCNSHIFALDLTNRKLLWEHDSGFKEDHRFNFAGGPLMGPDGKVYYFSRATGELVALGPAASQPKPTAGFLMINPSGGLVEGCVNYGDTIRFDGSCSIGKDLIYRYSADPPEGITITHDDDFDPAAQMLIEGCGQIKVTLQVEDEGGIGEWTQDVCIQGASPHCSFKITDGAGNTIDTADDGDTIPCLPLDQAAVADASLSTGCDLLYEYSVTPATGFLIDSDPASPIANITFESSGIFTVGLKVSSPGTAASLCIAKKVCVKDLKVPQNLRVTEHKTTVALAWDKVTDATAKGYNVYKSDVAGGPFVKITEPALGVDVDQYVDSAVAVGQDYFYRVRTLYAANQESAFSNMVSAVVGEGTEPFFKRGDVDTDGVVNITDVIAFLGWNFRGDPVTLSCLDAADTDNSGDLNVTDAIVSLGWNFRGDPPDLPSPGPYTCGPDKDEQPDKLDPCSYTCPP